MEDTVQRSQHSKVQKWAFGLGSFSQWFINAALTTWVFSFFFSAMGLEVKYITLAYIIWTFWNAFNDPLIGYISDRTHTRWGRRKPYIILGAIPLIIVETVMWIPPSQTQEGLFIYLLLMLILYDTAYTTFQVPYDSIFPELYTSVEERSEVNLIRQFLSIVGLLAAFLIPGYLILDLAEPQGYLTNGIITSVTITICTFISVKWGVKEKKEFQQDYKQGFGFFTSLKYCFKNKGFVLYSAMFFLYEYVLLVLSTVIPYYGDIVLEVETTFQTTLLLGILFVVGMVSLPLWRFLDVRLGGKKSYGIALIVYLVVSIPLYFVEEYISAVIVVVFMGMGFGGMLYFIYLLISDVIDEDELKTGVRREGTFFGITNFFMRLSMILSILTVSLVFEGTGWEFYGPKPGQDTIIGIKLLMVGAPGIAIVLSLICLAFYPYTKQKVAGIKTRLKDLHEEKQQRME